MVAFRERPRRCQEALFNERRSFLLAAFSGTALIAEPRIMPKRQNSEIRRSADHMLVLATISKVS